MRGAVFCSGDKPSWHRICPRLLMPLPQAQPERSQPAAAQPSGHGRSWRAGGAQPRQQLQRQQPHGQSVQQLLQPVAVGAEAVVWLSRVVAGLLLLACSTWHSAHQSCTPTALLLLRRHSVNLAALNGGVQPSLEQLSPDMFFGVDDDEDDASSGVCGGVCGSAGQACSATPRSAGSWLLVPGKLRPACCPALPRAASIHPACPSCSGIRVRLRGRAAGGGGGSARHRCPAERGHDCQPLLWSSILPATGACILCGADAVPAAAGRGCRQRPRVAAAAVGAARGRSSQRSSRTHAWQTQRCLRHSDSSGCD